MFSLEPQRTDYDVNFHAFGFPVRVHPLFWLVGLMLGASGLWNDQGKVIPNAAVHLLSWISVMFVSILIHELGHALIMRRYGQSSRIVLYMLGGLAIPENSFTSFAGPTARRTHNDNILISVAGPAAGFLLAALTALLIVGLGGRFHLQLANFPFFYQFILPLDVNYSLQVVIGDLLFMNIFWGLLNLLPIFPLDGGQVARELFEKADPWHGIVRSLWLSIFVAGGVAIGSWVYFDSRLMPLMFISLAATNYMMLQQLTGGGPGGSRW